MASQTDYIIAVGIFLIIFASFLQMSTEYFKTVRQTTHVETLRADALELLGAADRPFVAEEWRNESIGIATRAFRFSIIVDNSAAFLNNQSHSVTALDDELVSFNITLPLDNGSISIYDDEGDYVPYMLQGSNLTFSTEISANSVKNFTVYFDDDSNFTSRSATVTGGNNISETALNPEEITVIQHRKYQILNASIYDDLRNVSTIISDFNIELIDNQTVIFSLGPETPRAGDVVALEKYVVYQNATGGIRNGKIVVRTW